MNQASTERTVAWEADLLRFSAFPPSSVAFQVAPLWQQLVGHSPEEVQERPQQGLRNETGVFGEGHLFVVQQLARFDILYGIHPSKAGTQQDFISLGPYDSAAKAFLSAVGKWLESAPSLGRIAYAPGVVFRVSSHEEGYQLARKILPSLPIDEQSRDFSWQINRPRRSNVVDKLIINRLSKWSVIKREQVQVELGGGNTPRIASGIPMFAFKLELDINTEPLIPIPAESLQRLYNEITAAADEIIGQGDIP